MLYLPPWLLCLAATTIGFNCLCGWPCRTREAGSNALLRCRLKPLHPLPILPSSIIILPLRRPCKSSKNNRNMPWALEPICRMRTFSPSFIVLTKWSKDCLEAIPPCETKIYEHSLFPLKHNATNFDPSQQSVAWKKTPLPQLRTQKFWIQWIKMLNHP